MLNGRWAGVAILAAALLIGACGGDDEPRQGAKAAQSEIESKTAVFADYGGTSRTARTEAFFGPFGSETGVRVVSADADPSKLELFAETGRAEWDLIDLDGWDLVRFAEQGLLKELPSDVTKSDFVPPKWQKYATGGYNASIVIGYNTEFNEQAPASWADFFDTAKFPGKRGLPTFAYGVAEAALLADGVACEELYPLDLDRAFAKLDEIRDDVLFWDSFGQGMQFLAQGSASMVLTANSRPTVLKDQGLPVDLVWNDALFLPWAAPGVPKDAPHADAAFALIDTMAQPEQQAQFARLTFYGPTNSQALDLLDEETLDKLPNSPEHQEQACEVAMEALSKQIDEYTERYSTWLAQD